MLDHLGYQDFQDYRGQLDGQENEDTKVQREILATHAGKPGYPGIKGERGRRGAVGPAGPSGTLGFPGRVGLGDLNYMT